MRSFYFCQPGQYTLCQLMSLSLPDKVSWDKSAVRKLKKFAQFNCEWRLYKPNSTSISRTTVVDTPSFWQHYNLLWLKGDWQCSSGIRQVMRVSWVSGRMGQKFSKYNRQIITADKVAFTTTVRNILKFISVATSLISFQLREEELQKLFLCKNIRHKATNKTVNVTRKRKNSLAEFAFLNKKSEIPECANQNIFQLVTTFYHAWM